MSKGKSAKRNDDDGRGRDKGRDRDEDRDERNGKGDRGRDRDDDDRDGHHGRGHDDHGNGNGNGHDDHGNGNGNGHDEGGGGGGGGVTVVAAGDSTATTQGGTVSGNVLANDSISGAAVQSVVISSAPTGGSATIAGDGSFSYSAGAGFDALAQGETGVDSFAYTVTAVGGVSGTATVQVTVTGVNDAPVANPDVLGAMENGIAAFDLLANDTDVDHGAVLSIVAASTAPGQGSVNVSGNVVLFDPGSDFNHLGMGETATVLLSYAMQDEHGALSASTATITVTGQNDAPLGEPSRTVLVTLPGETPLGIVAPTDPDGDTLGVTITQAFGVGVLRDGDHNVVTLGSQLSVEQLSSITYAPASGAVGSFALLSYVVSDGNGGSATSTVAMLVVSGADAVPGVTASGSLALDTFDFNDIDAAPAVISGFATGAGGDVLDFSDLLLGYVEGSSDAGQFVRVQEAGGSSTLEVNADGIGADFVAIATLHGETGVTVNDLLADGNLFLG